MFLKWHFNLQCLCMYIYVRIYLLVYKEFTLSFVRVWFYKMQFNNLNGGIKIKPNAGQLVQSQNLFEFELECGNFVFYCSHPNYMYN